MKTIDQWLSEYGETHQNPLNKKIHYICVPLILWSILAILWALPKPTGFPINWVWFLIVPAMIFYVRLGVLYALEMAIVTCLALALVFIVDRSGLPLLPFAGTVFVLAWIGQFYGHKVEGKKPSFLQDVSFLLIGPLWIVNRLAPIHPQDKRTSAQ